MHLSFENLWGSERSDGSAEKMMDIKRKITYRVVDMYFEGDIDQEAQELVVKWMLNEDGADIKDDAMRRRFDMLFQ